MGTVYFDYFVNEIMRNDALKLQNYEDIAYTPSYMIDLDYVTLGEKSMATR
jgi:hypothetical protein